MYDKIKKSHRPYVEKILSELYPEKELTIEAICSKFVKKRHAIVCSSLKDLEKCGLIDLVNNSFKINEKSYKLSKAGLNIISPYMMTHSPMECAD